MPQELPEPRGNRAIELEERVRDLLVDQGLQEAITYSLTSPEAEESFLGERMNHVTLVNPISPERSVMRRSMLPGLLAVVRKNLETTDTVAMFELGFVYEPKAGAKLPDEHRRIAVILCGRRAPAAWDDPQGVKPARADFFDLKGVIQSLGDDLHLVQVSFAAVKSLSWLHPGRAASLNANGRTVGVFGELHPKTAAKFGLGEREVQVAELDLDAILAAVPDRYPYRRFSTFPPAKRDVAVIVPADMPVDRVRDEIRAAGGELLTGEELFDLYVGEGIPAGTKSLAFALTYQSPGGTLTEREIGKAHERVEGRLRHVLNAQIRGKD
jgi:phenylalanyl-tRNA synthetase beta chain